MAESNIPVLIVGAGPTGLTAAMELSRMGVDVRIVDRAAQPAPESRALAVQARTLELLGARGVGDTMLALGNRAHTAALYARGRKLAPIELHRMPSDVNFILMLAQSETERLLAEQLAEQGVKVERGIEVTSIAVDDPARVQVTLRTGEGTEETVTAAYVIAADGPHSTLRKSLGMDFPGRTLPLNYVLADLYIEADLPHDQVSIFLGSPGFVAVFPMGGGRFRLMATDPQHWTPERREPAIEDVQRLYDATVHIPARLHTMNWSSRFRINSRHMRTLRAGRVFFGGDAAHVHSPAGGQGMNLGIQDMVNLSWKLAMVLDGRAKPELLDTFSSERLPAIRTVVRFTEIGTRIFNSTNPIVHALRIRVAPRMLARDRVQDRAASMFGQLVADYRADALAENAGGIDGLRPGDRVPDIDPGTLDLNALTLFVGDGADDVADLAHGWAGVVAIRAGVSAAPGTWRLVRPDGYLAAAGRAGDGPVLAGWLHRWFVRSRA
ncbi:FAD-dependent oxidoreductase [Mycolicibacterium sp.]|uniref:FAD-dependent oxidoreductase n=1 Tax=Mycolicibacterium sp. TaxID=2320850 RepID=UPI003D0B1976